MASRAGYSFGDTATAEERLDLLADVFGPPSRAFLRDVVHYRPALACDLGCGPGNTTRMIRAVTGARRVVGLDRSAAFARAASERAGDDEFLVWDATDPLPVQGPDLVYARLLLAHLPEPDRLAAAWASQLAPGGMLLLDEVEDIDTSSEVFAEYLTVVVERIRAAGANMYAGPLLGAIPLGGDCRVITDQVVTHPVLAPDAARMFRLNLSVWGADPWLAERFGADAAARLDRQLAETQLSGAGHGQITWRLRQVAIKRGER